MFTRAAGTSEKTISVAGETARAGRLQLESAGRRQRPVAASLLFTCGRPMWQIEPAHCYRCGGRSATLAKELLLGEAAAGWPLAVCTSKMESCKQPMRPLLSSSLVCRSSGRRADGHLCASSIVRDTFGGGFEFRRQARRPRRPDGV